MNGTTPFDGILLMHYQEDWYTTCAHSYNHRHFNGDVICRELGYEGLLSSYHYNRPRERGFDLWYSLECNGDEDSVFDCNNCCGTVSTSYCYTTSVTYVCQSKHFISLHMLCIRTKSSCNSEHTAPDLEILWGGFSFLQKPGLKTQRLKIFSVDFLSTEKSFTCSRTLETKDYPQLMVINTVHKIIVC